VHAHAALLAGVGRDRGPPRSAPGMQKARRRRPLIHRPPAPPSPQVLFLQTKLGELHATDLVALRRAHATLAQHAGALQCESSDADELLRQVLESPLLSPEWWADELAAASIVGGSAWLLARVVRLDALAPKARRRARAHLWPSLPAIPPPPPPPPPRPCLPARLLGGQRRLVTRRRRPPPLTGKLATAPRTGAALGEPRRLGRRRSGHRPAPRAPPGEPRRRPAPHAAHRAQAPGAGVEPPAAAHRCHGVAQPHAPAAADARRAQGARRGGGGPGGAGARRRRLLTLRCVSAACRPWRGRIAESSAAGARSRQTRGAL